MPGNWKRKTGDINHVGILLFTAVIQQNNMKLQIFSNKTILIALQMLLQDSIRYW